ncbi:alpha/beta hydrolase [Altererythrobacter sp.]|nr:alpha/beta hydrolase [Altererythrobacter sp.]
MPSLTARLVNFALPLLGIKSFFSQPERVQERLDKARRKRPARPKAKWRAKFDISEDTSLGYPVVTIAPPDGARPGAPHLLYLHGGGYVLDIDAVHWDTICRLCEMLGASATVPVYPLAPEHRAPEILASMRALYGTVAEQFGAQHITLMGDSAGGGMSLALAQMLKRDSGPLPGRLVLWSPWLDATASAEGQAAIEPKDRMLAQVGLETCAKLYGGDIEPADQRLSPLFGDVAGLPPMAIFSGTSDILLVDGKRLAAKLAEVGASNFEYHEYDDMFHVWMLLPIPEGKQAVAQTVDFIRRTAPA